MRQSPGSALNTPQASIFGVGGGVGTVGVVARAISVLGGSDLVLGGSDLATSAGLEASTDLRRFFLASGGLGLVSNAGGGASGFVSAGFGGSSGAIGATG